VENELLLKAITHSMIGLAIITLLLVLLLGLRREIQGGEPIRGMFHLTIVVMVFCTFLALMVVLFSAKKMVVPEKISSRLDTAEFCAESRGFAWPPCANSGALFS
jgi:hypothetical protein